MSRSDFMGSSGTSLGAKERRATLSKASFAEHRLATFAVTAPRRRQVWSRNQRIAQQLPSHREPIMRKVITNEEMAVLKEAGEMFDETGCVPGVDGEQVPAEMIVPDAKPLAGTTLLGKQVGESALLWIQTSGI